MVACLIWLSGTSAVTGLASTKATPMATLRTCTFGRILSATIRQNLKGMRDSQNTLAWWRKSQTQFAYPTSMLLETEPNMHGTAIWATPAMPIGIPVISPSGMATINQSAFGSIQTIPTASKLQALAFTFQTLPRHKPVNRTNTTATSMPFARATREWDSGPISFPTPSYRSSPHP